MIIDEERLRAERADRKNWKSRVTGIEEFGPQGSNYGQDAVPTQRRKHERRPQRADENDIEYNLAIEASKHEAEEDEKRRKAKGSAPVDDDDLAKAIKLSKEEEELRRRELEESNANSLFDDTPAPTQPQYTGFNQGYQQQGAVDWFGNPVDQQPQQAQSTGFLNNAYSQPNGFQPQQTGFQQNGFQPQQTGFDSAFGQPSQNQPQPNNFFSQPNSLQPQQTAFNNANPYGNPQQTQQPNYDAFTQAQNALSPGPTTGSHNPWAQQQQPEALKPAPTGSNNPFASSFSRPPAQTQQSGPPTLSSLAEQRATTSFQSSSSPFNPITSFTPPPQQQQPPRKEESAHAQRLNQLLATGEGMDTFGNTGELRVPAQHTAPGNFVNSAGHGINKIHASQTGNNPFFSQQFTGAPQQSSNSPFQSAPPGQQQQNRFTPAQTGPASGFGGGFGQASNNPFGVQQHQQGGQAQGGSLIDL